DDGKKVNDDLRKENKCNDQEKEDNRDNVNSTNNVNTVSLTVNAAGTNKDNELPFDPNMPAFEDVGTFDFSNDNDDDDIVADMNNIDTTIQVSLVLTTRIHKDHPLDQGILRQFSVARTPQQNRVAERRNRTLIEAARTMLADSKLPSTFGHNKAFRVFNSRTRIVEENFHIRFSENIHNDVGSRPDWLLDIDALTRTMNYELIVAGTQSNDYAGTKASDNASQSRKETALVKDYILLPLWTVDLPFS
nr:putative ribonuclease H-like domain-containing protein [Tanacetum cinerariifolium]